MANIHKLTPMGVQKTKRLGWIADGGGLYLRVRKEGAKTWIFRYSRLKKRFDVNIGPVHTIPLGQARLIAADCRLAVIEGRDPRSVLNQSNDDHTFKDAATALIERKKKSWKSDKTHIKWRRSLMVHAEPLHNISVDKITVSDVEAIIRPLWYSQNHSARATRGKIEQTLDLATALGWRTGDNPARWTGLLEYLLPDHKPKVRHHAAMPYKDVPQFYAQLMQSHHDTKYALALTILTASRGHMVRHAVWDELDLKERLWTIPAGRMKRSEENHLVPLTPAMIALLPSHKTGLVFPYRGKGFSENAFRSTMKAMKLDYTAHGFRSSFKDWAADTTAYADEISEMALAHKVGSKVRRAYRRGKGLKVRRALMLDWCDYLLL